MAELIEIKKVLIGPDNMTAFVRVADDAPLLTSEDVEATARVYHLMPQIVDHACYGDAGETFRDAMGDTEITHLLEHVTVELLAQTDLAGDMPTGRTWVDEVDERTFEIDLACPDDVLVAAALSCGVWILDWAYSGGGDPEPNVDAIVAGLVSLVEGVGDQGEDLVIDYGPLEDEDVISADDLAPEGDSSVDAEIDGLTQDLMRTAEERPLWTPAPEVARIMHRSEEKKEPEPEPEVEAEIDEIMATIETPALVVDESGEAVEPVAQDETAGDEAPAADAAAEADAEDVAEADVAVDAADVAASDVAAETADVAETASAVDADDAETASAADAEAAVADDAGAAPEPESETAASAAAAVEAAAEPTAESEPAAANEEPAPREPTGAVAQALAAATAAEAARGRVFAEAREAADAAAEEAAATVIEELAEPAAPEVDQALSDIRVIAPATVVPSTSAEVSTEEAAEEAAETDVEDAAETRQEPDA